MVQALLIPVLRKAAQEPVRNKSLIELLSKEKRSRFLGLLLFAFGVGDA